MSRPIVLRLFALLVGSAALYPSRAFALDTAATAEAMANNCRSTDLATAFTCIYVLGAALGTEDLAVRSQGARPIFCLPPDAQLDQFAHGFVAWVDRHPAARQESFLPAILASMAETYPCPSRRAAPAP